MISWGYALLDILRSQVKYSLALNNSCVVDEHGRVAELWIR